MRFLSTLVSLFFFGALVAVLCVFLVVMHYSVGLPDYQQLAVYRPPITTRLYANDGSLLAEYATEKRVFVPVSEIPDMLKQAFISAEDKTFYTHGGVDFVGIARAAIVNARNMGANRRPVGASTITQQVAKNFLLTSERSLSRKIKEALLARRMEQAFTKDHILELYLNEIYLGQGAYGVASASLAYFNKSMNELTLGEMAYLAALPKAPNNYHPERHPARAKERRNWVLMRMAKDGAITYRQVADAMIDPIQIVERSQKAMRDGPYFSEEVRRFVVSQYGEEAIYLGGLTIRTSMDPELQAIAVKALQNGLLSYDKRHGWRGPVAHFDEVSAALEKLPEYAKEYAPPTWRYAVVDTVADDHAVIRFNSKETGTLSLSTMKWAKQSLPDRRISRTPVGKVDDVLKVGDLILVEPYKEAGTYALQQMPDVEGGLVAMDPHTGRVLALVGGFSFWHNQFNRAVQANRQPGSSFKPFVYLAALDSGYTPSSMILDAPIVMENVDGSKWKPQNYSRTFYGPTTLRVGVEKSRNLMTIRLAQALGMRKILNYGKKFGISDRLEPNLSTALGSGETTLMRLTAAYGMLVNGGKRIVPSLIDRIQDRDGVSLYKNGERVCEFCVGADVDQDIEPIVPDTREQIQDPVSAYQMTNILTGVIERGTGSVVRPLKKNLGAKSGTSNDSIDAWFVGFSPDLVVGVWVGFDSPQTLGPNDTGGVVAGPIFRDFMKEALANRPDIPFRVPDGVRLTRVNAATGKPATPGEKNVITEAFRQTDNAEEQPKIIGRDITIKEEDEHIPDLGGIY